MQLSFVLLQIDDETCTSDDQPTEIGEAFQEEGDRDLEEFAKPVPYSGKKKKEEWRPEILTPKGLTRLTKL